MLKEREEREGKERERMTRGKGREWEEGVGRSKRGEVGVREERRK